MTNRLAQSPSLYLRKHAENPIDWWPWCDEAIAKAREENQPIFLSIGYSSCHWCTVMEGEAFSDAAIAQYMNSQFVPIKVDREERPDVDSIYMQTLQMMTGQGGWPLNVFLSPDDLIPFYGGTYFPLEPKYGRPGFLQVLEAIRRLYDREPDQLAAVKADILENLHQAAQLPGGTDLSSPALQQGLDTCAGIISGGGHGPSFPMIPYALATLRGVRFGELDAALGVERQYDAQATAAKRGLDLALGGIYDHVAGGFHRYTVDPNWTVPHFEKMLYDNGQIMEFLAELWAQGIQEPCFERAIAGTADWLQREMTAPQGYFYAAQDADSFVQPTDTEPEEGAFYVWRYTDLETQLAPDELTQLSRHFLIASEGNFEGQIVLKRQPTEDWDEAVMAPILRKLFAIRYGAAELDTFAPARDNQAAKTADWPGRIPPVTDVKLIVAWNSLMISGLARAYGVFKTPQYNHLASRAADFILSQQHVGDRLHRLNYDGEVRVPAQAEDYALLIKALLDLHQAQLGTVIHATPDFAGLDELSQLKQPEQSAHLADPEYWLQAAVKLQAALDQHLWSAADGGYFNTADDASDALLVRERSYQDNATPAANGVAIANLVRLFLLTEDLAYLDRAEQGLQTFSRVIAAAPRACPSLLSALDWFQQATLVRTMPDWVSQVQARYTPTAMVRVATDLPEGAIALICQGLSCNAPAQSAEEFWAQLDASQQRPER